MNSSISTSPPSPDTVLDRLIEYLRAKDVALDGQERPVAILWTDPKAEWRSIIELMQTRVEELIVLGDYAPSQKTGPAIWIRCLVDRILEEPSLPKNRAPIVYLPGVARQDLRAGEGCPDKLKPIVELMFRGTLWLQHNGNDWSATTFLTSTKALGLDIAKDNATAVGILRALPEVVMTPVAQLYGRRLECDDFDRMLSSDVIRDLLRWMGDSSGTKARLGTNGWGAFCSRCRDELKFDPEADADVTAGEKLGKREGTWAEVWERFEEAPTSYPGIADLLRRSKPGGSLLFDREPWPDLNDQDENSIRKALQELPALSHSDACAAIQKLEKAHGGRRDWVWTRLGLSPMAQILEPLNRLAEAARFAIGGNTLEEMAAAYREKGWQADVASWEAIAGTPGADEGLVSKAVRHLVLPWLEDTARAFQKLVDDSSLPGPSEQPFVEAEENGCVLFSDGLRYDIGCRLSEKLESRGCSVALTTRWAASPTVTATGKPAISPVAEKIVGVELDKDFSPRFSEGERTATTANVRKSISERGYQILGTGELDVPLNLPARGWLEFGDIDSLGHKLKGRLPFQLENELERLLERVLSLLQSGWRSVRIVTDHGWLFVPGGMPKVELPQYLTESRWARCAVIAGTSTPDISMFPWYWNAKETFAAAPGVACFKKSEEYAHGGLSIQECLIPDILVERSGEDLIAASIDSVTWRGMRCFVEASAQGGQVIADLRLKRPGGESVVATNKSVEDGSVSLVLAGDEHEESQLVLVLLDENDNVLAHKLTHVGEDS